MPHPLYWATVLAGGNGERLRAFTKEVLGEERPKQFCRLIGPRTLLGETKRRVSSCVEPGQILYGVMRAHERYYRDELHDVDSLRRLEQPTNRGTAAALAYALARLRALGARGVLGLFPADHYYRNLAAFRGTVATAYALAERYPSGVLLVGAEADRAETDYGWIEPGPPIATERFALPRGLPVHRVHRFQEKPTSAEAARLLASGSLWNTFVVVGQTRAFEEMLEAAVPEMWARFQVLAHPEALASEKAVAEAVYAGLASADLSHDVIARYSERLMVVTLPDSGWADLGQPGRVLDVIAQVPVLHRERREPLGHPSASVG